MYRIDMLSNFFEANETLNLSRQTFAAKNNEHSVKSKFIKINATSIISKCDKKSNHLNSSDTL